MCVPVFKPKPEGCPADHVCFTQATSSDQLLREKRQRTIAKVENSIRNRFGQEFRIGTFGSTQYGVDGRNSDLDLVVIVGSFFDVSSPRE